MRALWAATFVASVRSIAAAASVLESLAITLPDAVPTGIAAGLHVYVQLLNRCDESSLIEARA